MYNNKLILKNFFDISAYACVYFRRCIFLPFIYFTPIYLPLFVGMMLRKLGHDVQEAINGAEVRIIVI